MEMLIIIIFIVFYAFYKFEKKTFYLTCLGPFYYLSPSDLKDYFYDATIVSDLENDKKHYYIINFNSKNESVEIKIIRNLDGYFTKDIIVEFFVSKNQMIKYRLLTNSNHLVEDIDKDYSQMINNLEKFGYKKLRGALEVAFMKYESNWKEKLLTKKQGSDNLRKEIEAQENLKNDQIFQKMEQAGINLSQVDENKETSTLKVSDKK